MFTRRQFVRSIALATAAIAVPLVRGHARGRRLEMTVYKRATCGCCKRWIELAEKEFEVIIVDTNDLDGVKRRLGVPKGLISCHTTTVGGYVVEGHVPLKEIHRMVREKPSIVGIAVAGMPAGSPGMEVAGGTTDKYDIVAFASDGSTSVYARY